MSHFADFCDDKCLRRRRLLNIPHRIFNNGQQPFHNADERQRKNQERQQQAFYLRRQMQNLHGEQFDLQSQLEIPGNSQQQGAVR